MFPFLLTFSTISSSLSGEDQGRRQEWGHKWDHAPSKNKTNLAYFTRIWATFLSVVPQGPLADVSLAPSLVRIEKCKNTIILGNNSLNLRHHRLHAEPININYPQYRSLFGASNTHSEPFGKHYMKSHILKCKAGHYRVRIAVLKSRVVAQFGSEFTTVLDREVWKKSGTSMRGCR